MLSINGTVKIDFAKWKSHSRVHKWHDFNRLIAYLATGRRFCLAADQLSALTRRGVDRDGS